MTNPTVRIVALSGSIREGSYNTRLIRVAARAAQDAGAEVRLVDLTDFPMPIYNRDLELADGLPATARALKTIFINSQGMLIASPEYNSSMTPLLKNTLDWLSRAEHDDEPPLCAYRGKVAGLLSASPGRLGGLRGLVHLRAMLGNIGVHVIPDQRAVAAAGKAFEDGVLVNEADRQGVELVAQRLVATAGRLSA